MMSLAGSVESAPRPNSVRMSGNAGSSRSMDSAAIATQPATMATNSRVPGTAGLLRTTHSVCFVRPSHPFSDSSLLRLAPEVIGHELVARLNAAGFNDLVVSG